MNQTESKAVSTDEWSPIRAAEQYYRDQGLNDDDIFNMQLSVLTPDLALPLLGFNSHANGVLIPHNGSGYLRMRRLGVDDLKYLSPKGSGTAPPYLPEGWGIDWDHVKSDPSQLLIITEGEIKSYWGCKASEGTVPTIGLGGVDMISTLFDGSWVWKDRTTQIAFDHDAGQNPGEYKSTVNDALGRLCSKLINHGAKVQVLHIGNAAEKQGFDLSRKYGLDDYVRSGGDLVILANTATAAPEWCEQLSDMMASCVYVVGTNHTHVYNLRNHSRKTPSDFHDAHVEKKRITKDVAGKPIVQPISRIWIEHPSRVTVDRYDLNPLLPFGVHGNKLNLWEGYPSRALPASLAKITAVQAEWQKFMEGLFGTDEVEATDCFNQPWSMPQWKWIGLWTGHLLNQPEERCNQGVMLLTMVEGIGKSLWGDVIRDLCGKHGLEGKVSRMFSSFNSEMEAKTFIMVNELDVKFTAKEGQLKDLLAEEVVKIEQKGKDVIEHPNLRRWYFTTNTSNPCHLSPRQRRVFVITPPRVVGDTRGEWGQWVNSVIAMFRKDDEALAAIRLWFDNLWLAEGEGRWSSTTPTPMTEAGESVSEASLSKKQILARTMWEHIQSCKDGWTAVHPDFKSRDNKLWGEVLALVKAHGGRSAEKVARDGGASKAFTVYISDQSKVHAVPKPKFKGWTAMVESEEVRTRARQTAEKLTQSLVNMGLTHFDTPNS